MIEWFLIGGVVIFAALWFLYPPFKTLVLPLFSKVSGQASGAASDALSEAGYSVTSAVGGYTGVQLGAGETTQTPDSSVGVSHLPVNASLLNWAQAISAGIAPSTPAPVQAPAPTPTPAKAPGIGSKVFAY